MKQHYQVGAAVEARRDRNALNRWFPATVTRVTVGGVPCDKHAGWNRDASVCAYYFFCCFVCYPRPRFYDLDYESGETERHVPASLVREAR